MKRILLLLLLKAIFVRVVKGQTCRMSRKGDLSVSQFETESCKMCYQYSQFKLKHSDLINKLVYPDMLQNQEILDSLGSEKAKSDWTACCRNAQQCCETMVAKRNETEPGWCPRTWDGWLCWPDTEPGVEAQKTCPIYSITTSCSKENAVKTCLDNGTWGRHPFNSSTEWTNYLKCPETERKSRNVYIGIIAYSISVLTLVPALYIFFTFSILKCVRVLLHRNLFISLLLHSAMQIIFFYIFLMNESAGSEIKQNGALCRIISVVIIYLTVANYSWMFCEGLFLHRQLIHVFVEETRVWLFYVIGWGFPAIPALIVIIFRVTTEDINCWALPSVIDWVWLAPCLISLLVNCIFFIHIMRVLVKLLSRHTTPELTIFRKAVHAGLVMVPLFGLQFLLTIYRPTNVCTVAEEYYLYLNRVLEGLQGSLVAITYCYINSEVRSALFRTGRNIWDRHTPNGQYTSAVSTQTIQYTC